MNKTKTILNNYHKQNKKTKGIKKLLKLIKENIKTRLKIT